jgi:hypothetical protein
LPPDLAERLESLSFFRHRVVGPDPDSNGNPVALSHTILTVGNRTHHVLSRIADTGFDHTGRSNFLAHHLVLTPNELPDAGPAWLLGQPALFLTAWDPNRSPEPDLPPRRLPDGMLRPQPCHAWARAVGDAGWAGVLAAATGRVAPAYLIYAPGQNPLEWIGEALALFHPKQRWTIPFTTDFTGNAAGTPCQWRCVRSDSPEARQALTESEGTVIRMDRPTTQRPSGPFVEAARAGRPVPPAVSSAVPPPLPSPFAENLPDREDTPFFPADPMPGSVATPSTPGRGRTRSLLIGLGLGAWLGFVGIGLTELGTDRSLASLLRRRESPEERWVADGKERERQLDEELRDAHDRRRSAEQERDRLRNEPVIRRPNGRAGFPLLVCHMPQLPAGDAVGAKEYRYVLEPFLHAQGNAALTAFIGSAASATAGRDGKRFALGGWQFRPRALVGFADDEGFRVHELLAAAPGPVLRLDERRPNGSRRVNLLYRDGRIVVELHLPQPVARPPQLHLLDATLFGEGPPSGHPGEPRVEIDMLRVLEPGGR